MLPLQVLYSSVLPLPLLHSPDHSALLVVYCTFFSPTFVRLLWSHLLRSYPWPPSLSGPPSPLVPLDEPQPGPSGLHRPVVLVSVHIEHVDDSFFLVHSVCFIHLASYHSAIYICHMISVSYIQFSGFGGILVFFPFPRSPGGQKGCGSDYGAGGPQEKGPTSLATPPNLRPNDPDWTVPHLWQDL